MTRWILLSLLALTACGDKETETGSEADTDALRQRGFGLVFFSGGFRLKNWGNQ